MMMIAPHVSQAVIYTRRVFRQGDYFSVNFDYYLAVFAAHDICAHLFRRNKTPA